MIKEHQNVFVFAGMMMVFLADAASQGNWTQW